VSHSLDGNFLTILFQQHDSLCEMLSVELLFVANGWRLSLLAVPGREVWTFLLEDVCIYNNGVFEVPTSRSTATSSKYQHYHNF